MSLLRELQDETRNEAVPVAQALRSALVLAQRLDYEPLAEWSRRELDGYPDDAELPAYRAYRSCHVYGDFVGPAGSWERARPLPRGGVDEAHREALFGFELRQGVAFFQGFVENGKDSLQIPWDGSIVVYYQDRFLPMMALRGAYRAVGLGEIRQLLDAVRTRLLEFVLEIERSAPDAGEASPGEKPVDDARLDQAFAIYITGDNNIVAAGRDISQRVKISEQPEWASLAKSLEDLGLDARDIARLQKALEVDSGQAISEGSLGPETRHWYEQVRDRVASGALHLTGEATAAVIAGLLLDFLVH